jgi:hypothetical protein
MDVTKLLYFQVNQGNKTNLDKAYRKHVTTLSTSFDEETETRWETYNMIIHSLIKNTKYDYITEIKYRLTDGENVNEIILDIINREVLDADGLVWLLKRRVEEYLEEDFFKRFYH